MSLKFNTSSMVKGVIYALILSIGMLVGVLLEVTTDNFYVVWGVVSVINIAATILVFRFIKNDLKTTQETAFDRIEKEE